MQVVLEVPDTLCVTYLALSRMDDWFQTDELSTKVVIPGYGFPSIAQPVYAAPVTLH
jgi:hypothetical protein